MKNAIKGTSLLEIVIAIAIAGLLAMVSMPKFVNSQRDLGAEHTDKVDQLMQMLVSSFENYQAATGKSIEMPRPVNAYGNVIDTANEYNDGPNTNNNWLYNYYEKIFHNYGSFMGYRRTGTQAKYFIMPDQSILAFDARKFSNASATFNSEYWHSTRSALGNEWKDASYSYVADNNNIVSDVSAFCGEYHSDECIFVDVTGKYGVNKIGIHGDIVPLRMDPANMQIKTLYQWHYEDFVVGGSMTQAAACRFVSFYDVAKNAPGVDNCTTEPY